MLVVCQALEEPCRPKAPGAKTSSSIPTSRKQYTVHPSSHPSLNASVSQSWQSHYKLNVVSSKLTTSNEMKERSLDTTSLSDPALWEPVGAVPAVEIGTGGFEVIVFKTELGSVVGVAAAGVQEVNPKLKSADDTSLAFRLYVSRQYQYSR